MMSRKDIKPGAMVRVSDAMSTLDDAGIANFGSWIYSGTRWEVIQAPRKLLQLDGSSTRGCYVALRRGKIQREVRATDMESKCTVVGHRKEPAEGSEKPLPKKKRPTSWDFIMRDD